ncbi:MAG: excinuclease ABC subunit C, partial [Gammaproteobacteria bacterium]|nr:excinuclease ABC subunit C [Gammaproteobacteria bacterium]
MGAGFDAKEFVGSLPRRPGVYRMFAADGSLLYVGKAKSLRDRVGSYFLPSNVIPKVQALVAQITAMEVTVTRSETEALLLEHNLIKALHPKYNVVLRDDKSFPYLWLSGGHDFPRLAVYRGSRNLPGRFFGPYPNAGAVSESLHYLQKIFRLRNCRDTYFANRSRPCLQHQIGRCSAPCVGLVSQAEYARDVESAVQVLEGRNDEVQQRLAQRMEEASTRLEFERAAALRDQIGALKELQAQQVVAADDERDADVFAIAGDALAEALAPQAGYVVRVRRARRQNHDQALAALATDLGLAAPPQRLECFDISHMQGEGTVASCVVFGPEGPLKKDYRRFNIEGVTPGDDYAALRAAIARRYARIAAGEIPAPDLLVIDGGPAQLAGVVAV